MTSTAGEITVANDELDPALIRAACLGVYGTPTSWNDYFAAGSAEAVIHSLVVHNHTALSWGAPTSVSISISSVGTTTTIRPGDVKPPHQDIIWRGGAGCSDASNLDKNLRSPDVFESRS